MNSVPQSAWGPLVPEPATDSAPRCSGCDRLLAEVVTRPWVIRCSRCKATNVGFLPHQEGQVREVVSALSPMGSRVTANKPPQARTQAHRRQ